MTGDVPRGFSESEFEARLARAQRSMAEGSIDALLLTTEPEVRYCRRSTSSDQTVLKSGMMLTLEPGLQIGPGRSMVHEEDVVVTADGAELLTRRAPAELPVIT